MHRLTVEHNSQGLQSADRGAASDLDPRSAFVDGIQRRRVAADVQTERGENLVLDICRVTRDHASEGSFDPVRGPVHRAYASL